MTENEAQCFLEFVTELNRQPSKPLLGNEIVLRFTQFLEQRNCTGSGTIRFSRMKKRKWTATAICCFT